MTHNKGASIRHWSDTYPTSVKDVDIRINYTKKDDGQIKLRGYLIHRKTHIRLDFDQQFSTTASSITEIQEKSKYLVARATAAYHEYLERSTAVPSSEPRCSDAYNKLTDSEKNLLLSPSWRAASTKRQHQTYFQNALRLIEQSNIPITQKNAEDIAKLLIDRTQKNSRTDPQKSSLSACNNIKAFNYMYSSLCKSSPDMGLPELILPLPQAVDRSYKEQCKVLPDWLFYQLSAALYLLIPNGLAIGAVLMLTGMLRTAEACALLFSEIIMQGDYAVYCVLHQRDASAARCADLKTDSSYRSVVLPKFAVDCLAARIDWLKKQGYQDSEINKMPVVAKAADPTAAATPNELSAFVRQLINDIGISQEFWVAATDLMTEEPDYIMDGKGKRIRIDDVSAYILRRNACTRYCNSGVSPLLVDALMGHKLPRAVFDWSAHIRRRDKWPIIAQTLECVIFHPEHSANPAFHSVGIAKGSVLSTMDHIRHTYIAEDEVEVEFEITSTEDASTLWAETSGEIISYNSSTAFPSKSQNAFALGEVFRYAYYQKFLDKTAQMDLSRYLPAHD